VSVGQQLRWRFLIAALAAVGVAALLVATKQPRSNPPGIPTGLTKSVDNLALRLEAPAAADLTLRLEAPAKVKAGAELKLALTVRNGRRQQIKFCTEGAWEIRLSPVEEGRPALFSPGPPWAEREGKEDRALVLDLAPGAEEKLFLRCIGWGSRALLTSGIRPLPGKYAIAVTHTSGPIARDHGYWVGTVTSGQTTIEVEDNRAAEGRPADGLTAALSVSPVKLEIPADPATPPVCPFALSLDVGSTGTRENGGRLRLVPFWPVCLEIVDGQDRPIAFCADPNQSDPGALRDPTEAEFPEISTQPEAKPARLKLEGILGCDGTLFVSSPTYGTWRTAAPLASGTYRLRAVYANDARGRGAGRQWFGNCWVGTVVSNPVTLTVGKPPAGLVTAERAAEIGLKELCARNPGWKLKPDPAHKPVLVRGYVWRVSASDPVPKPAMGSARVDIDARTGKILDYKFFPGA